LWRESGLGDADGRFGPDACGFQPLLETAREDSSSVPIPIASLLCHESRIRYFV
jgi:hypothetical protein